ncbi:hypothetical protein CPT_Mano_048 [Achromobacter phage Mano]|uniref:Uncharacterized protein n=1 Tax=Achromobacter phage Mano TaxID=2767570 RepID=A0A7L8G885_9CAUD|nr:hypothetical protein KB680_gp43 [Achromobacter phage Mano]QOE32780.1 hypothetical protein CPT_Mano_048 [Achromobacter phage Mano]
MTKHNNAAQRVLTDDEIQDIADGFDIYGAKPEFARAIESALLSKLRAPVADAGNWQQYRLRGSDENAEQVIERERRAYADLLQSVMDKRRDQASAPVACNCPGGNKPVDLHAPNCPVRTAKATLIDPYDGGTWLASAPVAGEAQPVACLRRQIDGSDWGHWKPGSVEDGQRVTGLRSWQVRWLVDAAPQASAEDDK